MSLPELPSLSPLTYSRRQMLLAAAAAASAGCARQIPRRTESQQVSITRAASYSQELYDVVPRILREHRLDVRGKHVVLKPNLVEFEENGAINTHPLLVHAAFEAVRAMGAKQVTLAEGPGHRRATLEMCERAGYFDIVRDFEASFVDLNLDDVTPVRLSRPASKLDRLYLPNTVLGADLLISMPKMKTHHWAGATLSMKNLFGVVPGGVYGWPKNVLHWAGIDECIADLYRTLPRHFCLVDGIDGMEGNGPIQGLRKHAGVLVSGGDMARVDATCCRLMGIDPSKVRYLQLASGIKNLAESNIRQLGVSIASAKQVFDLPPGMSHLRLT
jgi:uncharacterized protein (DUF362 family)